MLEGSCPLVGHAQLFDVRLHRHAVWEGEPLAFQTLAADGNDGDVRHLGDSRPDKTQLISNNSLKFNPMPRYVRMMGYPVMQ